MKSNNSEKRANNDRPGNHPENNKIEIYTQQWCPYCRKTKAFLKSKDLSYQEYDVADEDNFQEMVERSGGEKTVPQVFINGEHFSSYDGLIKAETSGKLEDLLGITFPDYTEEKWDLIIIGAGPAGMTAGVYAVRKGIKTLLLTTALGGQVLETDSIENYLARYQTPGPELMQEFWEHLHQYEIATAIGERVAKISPDGEAIVVESESGRKYRTKSLIIATGTHKRHLGVPGENRLKGKGVHYCSVCDGHLYGGQPVAVVGGGNSGLESSLDMARLGSEVSLIEVADSLRGDKYLQEQVKDNEKIEVYTSYKVKEIKGDDHLESIVLRENNTGKVKELDLDAVFIEIGLIPNSGFACDLVMINDRKEIIIDEDNATDVEGVWAAGDVTAIKDKQIIISSAEGAKAALRVNEYLD